MEGEGGICWRRTVRGEELEKLLGRTAGDDDDDDGEEEEGEEEVLVVDDRGSSFPRGEGEGEADDDDDETKRGARGPLPLPMMDFWLGGVMSRSGTR